VFARTSTEKLVVLFLLDPIDFLRVDFIATTFPMRRKALQGVSLEGCKGDDIFGPALCYLNSRTYLNDEHDHNAELLHVNGPSPQQ
jgi:hypothetical protein